jgi:glutamate-1-semialdehyde 2,1-aminomutase
MPAWRQRTLKVLAQPGTYARLDAIGDRFRAATAEIFKRHGVPGQTIGAGPLSQIVLTDQPVVDYRSSISGGLVLQRKLATTLVKNGVLTNGKFYFSLATSDDDLTRILDIFDRSTAEVLR